MKLTKTMAKAIQVIGAHDGTRARSFGKLMWPDAKAWSVYGNVGHGVTRGVGMQLMSGGYLGKLRKRGLVYLFMSEYDNRWHLTNKGIEELKDLDGKENHENKRESKMAGGKAVRGKRLYVQKICIR